MSKAQVGPAGVNTGIKLWLDASNVNNTTPASNPANGSPVFTWKDVSGNGNNATVLSGQNTPTMGTASINGNDVVKFTRTSNVLGTVYQVAGIDIRATSTPKATIFTVYKQGTNIATDWQGIWGDDNGGWDRFFMPRFGSDNGIVSVGPTLNNVAVAGAGVVGTTKLLTAVYDNATTNGSTIYFNAVPVQTVTDNTSPTAAQSTFRIGWDGDDNPFGGDIAELIVYDRKLTDCEIKAVNRYLGYKYGVTFTSATITPSGTTSFCTGSSVTLTASSGTSYQWMLGNSIIGGATSSTYSATTAGSYRVIVTTNGCSDTSIATTVKQVYSPLYVDGSVAASGTGASWSSPIKTLAEALDLANNASCGVDIWVKAGTYYPTTAAGLATTNRDSSFRILRNNIKVYGGFAGTETSLSQRNVTTNVTTLSGDLGIANDSTDNSYHVVTIVASPGSTIDTNTRLDGFTISGGNGYGASGSFLVNGQNINRADGGGLYNFGISSATTECSPAIAECTIAHNAANYGGGVYNAGYNNGKSSPWFTSCIISYNNSNSGGGGAFSNGNPGTSSPIFRSCSFIANSSTGSGGGIYTSGSNSSTPEFTNCTFTANNSNHPSNWGWGGAMLNDGTKPTITGCIFTSNVSGGGGGAIGCFGTALSTINDCIFYSNSSLVTGYTIIGSGGAFQHNGASTTTFTHCVFDSNTANGTGDDGGGAIMLYFGTVTLNSCTFNNNTTVTSTKPNSNTISLNSGTSATLNNCIIWGSPANHIHNLGTITYNYSSIKGVAASGTNISANPQFVSPTDPDGADNIWATADDGLRLNFISPAINAGSNALIPLGVTTDIAGAARIQNTTVDMGAYEGWLNQCPTSSRVYVDSSLTYSGDGTSWSQAYKTVWEGLTVANQCTGVGEVWVAKGNYYPMLSAVKMATSRDSSLRILRNGVKLYGGFSGTETALSQRNITGNVTTLSGDIGVSGTTSDNSYHVMTILTPASTTIDTSTVVSGFTITAGNANGGGFTYNGIFIIGGDGGGILNAANSTGSTNKSLIESNIFYKNLASVGGGLYCGGYTGGISSPTVRNCLFNQNSASDVGALHSRAGGSTGLANPSVVNCVFTNNTANQGGAMGAYSDAGGSANPSVTNCIFSGNSATNAGGVFNIYAGSFTATNSVFESNTAGTSGGGVVYVPGGFTATFNNCTLNNNTTTSSSKPNSNAIVANSGSTVVLRNTIVWGSAANQIDNTGTANYNYSDLKGIAASGTNLSADPLFNNSSDADGADNTWATTDDGLELTPCSPLLNAGSNSLIPTGVTTDVTNGSRIQFTTVDMGAYESPNPIGTLPVTATTVNPTTCGGTNGAINLNGLTSGNVYTLTYSANGVPQSTLTLTANSSGVISITGLSAGSYTAFTITYGACTGTIPGPIVLAPPASPVISGTSSTNPTVCNGTNGTIALAGLTASTSYTVSYTKNSGTPTNLTISADAAGVITITGLSAGTYTNISVSQSNCPSNVVGPITLTDPPTPSAPVAGSNSPVCQGTALNLTAIGQSGASFSWSGPSSFSSTTQNPTIASMAAANAGTYSVTQTVAGCTSPAATVAVTMATPPATPGTISGNAAPCANTANTYSVAAVATATSYTWTLPSGWSGSSVSNSIAATTSTTGGTISVTASNGCGTSTAATLATTITTIPAQPATISGPATLCSGATASYTIAAVSGATSYSWTLPSGWSGANTAPNITATAGSSGGNISVAATNVCGSSTPKTLAVTVNTIPSQPGTITGNNNPCVNSSQTYSVAAVSGATSYAWTYPSGWSGGSTTNTITYSVGANSGNVSVAALNSCGTSTAISLPVTVIQLPGQPGPISGPAAPCVGVATSYSASAASGATSYVWSVPSGWTGVSTTATLSVTPGSTGGTITLTPVGVCGNGPSQTLSVSTTAVINPQVSISVNNNTLCQGAMATFTATPVNGGTAPVYQWKRNGVNITGAVGPTFSSNSLSNGDVITVQMSSSAPCVSAPVVTASSITMTINPTIVPGININTTPPTILCAGTPILFTTNIVGGGSSPSYQWRKNGVVIGTATGATYTDAGLISGDTIQVVLTTSALCPSSATALSNKVGVVVSPVVVPSVAISASPSGVLSPGTVVTFTATQSGGGATPTYQWKKNGVIVAGVTGDTYTTATLKEGDHVMVSMQSYEVCASPSVVTSNEIIVHYGSTGIASTSTGNNNWEGSVVLYPNPNSGHFTVGVSWGAGRIGKRASIDIINALGQGVYHLELSPTTKDWSHELWLGEGIANGGYMLRVATEDGMKITLPFILNR